MPAFKIRWRGYDRAEVEQYLRENKKREWSITRLDQATQQELIRLTALRCDIANCLLEIGAAAERHRQALLAADTQSEGRPVDVEAGLQALSPTGEVDQPEPGELLHSAKREVERLIGLRRDIANGLLEIATSAERDGRALLAATGKGNNGVGNGLDPQPPGNPPINDGPGTGPGNSG